jgi:hypothetical protein
VCQHIHVSIHNMLPFSGSMCVMATQPRDDIHFPGDLEGGSDGIT